MKKFSIKMMVLGIFTFLSFAVFSFFAVAQKEFEPIPCEAGYKFDRSVWNCEEPGTNCKVCEPQKI